MTKVIRSALVSLLVVVGATSCGGSSSTKDTSSSEKTPSTKSQTEREQYARQMCDTNAGGYYHIDQKCYDRYMGK